MTDQVGTLKQTALLDRHQALGARIVPFAGWEMPVQYEGILAEHLAVRTNAGLFDLGHMGQVEIVGPDALAFLQFTTTNDVGSLEPGDAKYGLLPNESGGVVDDIIVYRNPPGHDGYMVCVNASNTDKDVAWWQELRSRRVDLDVTVRDVSTELGMIAIQGPRAEAIVKRVTDALVENIDYFSWRIGTIAGVEARIARTGYTGEDGFEFYAANSRIGEIWDALMEAGEPDGIAPIGLGARDTLRLEARMPLYGQELGDDISPYEAGLGWAVSLTKGDFIGREPMEKMKSDGPKRRTVGFTTVGRTGAPRSHNPVEVDGEEVGTVTSGTFSPTLQQNIGLALIDRSFAGVGKPLQVIVRGKPVDAVQVKTPFYKRDR
ncbi:MAG: glycine cleavage system aminomethyltransferase GcvT [Chloroflexota bacterium]|nr:glycine cleavage system aminomethyltransferase GcvT [Chloroflexota bacterium]